MNAAKSLTVISFVIVSLVGPCDSTIKANTGGRSDPLAGLTRARQLAAAIERYHHQTLAAHRQARGKNKARRCIAPHRQRANKLWALTRAHFIRLLTAITSGRQPRVRALIDILTGLRLFAEQSKDQAEVCLLPPARRKH